MDSFSRPQVAKKAVSVMRRRNVSIFVGLCVLVSVAGVLIGHQLGSTPARAASETGSITSSLGSAPPLEIAVLTTTIDDTIDNSTFRPPPDNYNPQVSAAEAYETAWGVHPTPSAESPTAAKATLALVSARAPFLEDVPAWVITYSATCVITHGPGSTPDCRSLPFHVVIGAENGAYMFSYADSFDAPELSPSADQASGSG
jgi:hypothetical protein